MKNLKLALWIFLLWLFQTVFSRYIKIDGISPELLYVFVLCMSMIEKKPSYYISISVICGLIADVSVGGIPGFYLLTYICSTFLIVGVGQVIYKETFLIILSFVFCLSIVSNSLYFLLNNEFLQNMTYILALKEIILPATLYNIVAAILINPILKMTVYSRKKRRRR